MTHSWTHFRCTFAATVLLLALTCYPIWVHLLRTCFPGTAVWLEMRLLQLPDGSQHLGGASKLPVQCLHRQLGTNQKFAPPL